MYMGAGFLKITMVDDFVYITMLENFIRYT